MPGLNRVVPIVKSALKRTKTGRRSFGIFEREEPQKLNRSKMVERENERRLFESSEWEDVKNERRSFERSEREDVKNERRFFERSEKKDVQAESTGTIIKKCAVRGAVGAAAGFALAVPLLAARSDSNPEPAVLGLLTISIGAGIGLFSALPPTGKVVVAGAVALKRYHDLHDDVGPSKSKTV